MHVFGYKTSNYFNMENKVVEGKINWEIYRVTPEGRLINIMTGEEVGQYLYEDEEVSYSSVVDAIKTTLRFAF